MNSPIPSKVVCQLDYSMMQCTVTLWKASHIFLNFSGAAVSEPAKSTTGEECSAVKSAKRGKRRFNTSEPKSSSDVQEKRPCVSLAGEKTGTWNYDKRGEQIQQWERHTLPYHNGNRPAAKEIQGQLKCRCYLNMNDFHCQLLLQRIILTASSTYLWQTVSVVHSVYTPHKSYVLAKKSKFWESTCTRI